MRLWHKDLIQCLPDQQLRGQWRECCSIMKSIKENGTPNHLLVNKVTDYPPEHLYSYADIVSTEMRRRGYKVDLLRFDRYMQVLCTDQMPLYEDLFAGWHDERYLIQCIFNLEEKYDCGGIPEGEWEKIENKYPILIPMLSIEKYLLEGGKNGKCR